MSALSTQQEILTGILNLHLLVIIMPRVPRNYYNSGMLSAIGNTPLIALSRVIPQAQFKLFAKLESLNPGGSMKDRPALKMVQDALDRGIVGPDTVIVESSSGNMGIGLAQACRYFNLRFICVVDPKTTAQNLTLLRAYGAEIDLVTEPDAAGGFLKSRLNRVNELLRLIENCYWPNQYSSPQNSLAHHVTMSEIVRDLGQPADYLFAATSTCGTVRGCSEYVRQNNLPTKIFAVDAVGSVIFGHPPAGRLIPGHGAAIRPPLFQTGIADECVHISDLESVTGCRRLVRDEALLMGGSSGAVISAVEKVKHRIPDDAVCVAILADRGERYLDTIYSDDWVLNHFGEVSHLWRGPSRSNSTTTTAISRTA